jgi:hypothetical protein
MPTKPKKKKQKREYVPLGEKLQTGDDWRTVIVIKNSIASKILEESKGRDDCAYDKILNERLEDSFQRKPFKKK